MDRLSGLDASFLYLETPAQLMHVCAVMVLDQSTMPTSYTFGDLMAHIDDSVHDVPAFTRKLRGVPMGLDHPVWVRDQQFDIERHVHRLAVPSPGGYRELMDLCAHLAALPLDRSRPLWEMWVIEGYRPDGPDGAAGDEKVVVFSKMHHATVDGVSGSNLISHLCALEPDAPPLAVDETQRHHRDPSRAELLGRAVVGTATKPVTLVKVLAPSAELITKSIGRAREGTAMAAPFSAPRTSFNGTITAHRTIALADLALDDIREIKKATGSTVNDVVLTLCGGALRSYLDERGEMRAEVHQLAVAARARHGQPVHVALDVELLVPHPHRVVEAQRDTADLAREGGHVVHAAVDVRHQVVEGVRLRHRARVEDHHRAHVHELRRRLEVEEARVEPRQPVHPRPPMN